MDNVSKLNSPDMAGGIEYKPVALHAEGCVYTVGGKVLTSWRQKRLMDSIRISTIRQI